MERLPSRLGAGPLADYAIGSRVMTREGYPGVIDDIHEGPADLTTYFVTLDNGQGGGEYAEAEISPLSEPSTASRIDASVERTAADDYPELGSILTDRLPPALHTTAAKTAATCSGCGEEYETGPDGEQATEGEFHDHWTAASIAARLAAYVDTPESEVLFQQAAELIGRGNQAMAWVEDDLRAVVTALSDSPSVFSLEFAESAYEGQCKTCGRAKWKGVAHHHNEQPKQVAAKLVARCASARLAGAHEDMEGEGYVDPPYPEDVASAVAVRLAAACDHPSSTMVQRKHHVELYSCDSCGAYRFYDGSAEEDITGWLRNPGDLSWMMSWWQGDLNQKIKDLRRAAPPRLALHLPPVPPGEQRASTTDLTGKQKAGYDEGFSQGQEGITRSPSDPLDEDFMIGFDIGWAEGVTVLREPAFSWDIEDLGKDQTADLPPATVPSYSPGMMASKTAATMYHYAPVEARDSIAQHGLDWRKGPYASHPLIAEDDDGNEIELPHANYLYRTLNSVREALPEGFEIYEVDTDGLDLQPDPYEDTEAVLVNETIPAIKVHRMASAQPVIATLDSLWDKEAAYKDDNHGGTWSFDWCRFRRDSHCYLPKELNEDASKKEGYAVWVPFHRGYCHRSAWVDQQKCPVGEPGPNSGSGGFTDATVPWEEGGQRGGTPSGTWASKTAAFEVTAKWRDIQAKAKRIRSEGGVRLVAINDNVMVAHVKGDHGIYETEIVSMPGRRNAASWHCGCKWSSYSWGRSGPWKKFEGRMCSHALALQYEAQSRGSHGREMTLDEKQPAWMDSKHVHRPGDYSKEKQRYSVLEQHDDEAPPIEMLAHVMLREGAKYQQVRQALLAQGVEKPVEIIKAARKTTFWGRVRNKIEELILDEDDGVKDPEGHKIPAREVLYPKWHPTKGLQVNDNTPLRLGSRAPFAEGHLSLEAAWQTDAGANGDLPEGLEFKADFRIGYDGEALATAYVNGEPVAGLRWNYYSEPSVVLDLFVEEPYRRRGVATALWNWVKTTHQSDLEHSTSLTDDGKAFRQTLGAKDQTVPPSEHGDPRMQDAGVTVSKTKDGKYYVHTHRARGKYRDSVSSIPDSEIEYIRSTGALEAAWHEAMPVGPMPEGLRWIHKPVRLPGVPAQHMLKCKDADGLDVGHIRWLTKDYKRPPGKKGEITYVFVQPEYRRRGLATELLRKARLIEPEVHHSPVRTEDGLAWSEKAAAFYTEDDLRAAWEASPEAQSGMSAEQAMAQVVREQEEILSSSVAQKAARLLPPEQQLARTAALFGYDDDEMAHLVEERGDQPLHIMHRSYDDAFLALKGGVPCGQITYEIKQDENAYSDDDDVAMAAWGDHNGYYAEIDALVVDKHWRRRGIGTALLKAFIEWADQTYGYRDDPKERLGWKPGSFTKDGAALWKAVMHEDVPATQRMHYGQHTAAAEGPVVNLTLKGHLWGWHCPNCTETQPGKGYLDHDNAKELAETHGMWCYDLDWGDTVQVVEPTVQSEGAKRPPAVLYHYTSQIHLPRILSSGHLRLTDSNIEISGAGPPVVWLTTTVDPGGNGLDGGYDKGSVRFTVEPPNRSTFHWPTWAFEQGIEGYWYDALDSAGGGGSENWWVCTEPIPLDRVLTVEVNGVPYDFRRQGAKQGSGTTDYLDFVNQHDNNPDLQGPTELIREYGKHWRRKSDDLASVGLEKGPMGNCFGNALNAVLVNPDLIYVEGYSNGGFFPMHHAWVVDGNGTVFDPTWDDGTDYYGIPFHTDWVARYVRTSGYTSVMGTEFVTPGLEVLMRQGIPYGAINRTGAKEADLLNPDSPVIWDRAPGDLLSGLPLEEELDYVHDLLANDGPLGPPAQWRPREWLVDAEGNFYSGSLHEARSATDWKVRLVTGFKPMSWEKDMVWRGGAEVMDPNDPHRRIGSLALEMYERDGERYFHVTGLGVQPQYQRQGIATAMWEAVHAAYPGVVVKHSGWPGAQTQNAKDLNRTLKQKFPGLHEGRLDALWTQASMPENPEDRCTACSGTGEQRNGHECYICDASGQRSAELEGRAAGTTNANPENGLPIGQDDSIGEPGFKVADSLGEFSWVPGAMMGRMAAVGDTDVWVMHNFSGTGSTHLMRSDGGKSLPDLTWCGVKSQYRHTVRRGDQSEVTCSKCLRQIAKGQPLSWGSKGSSLAKKDDGPSVSGVALKAADTGRILMLQRGLEDEDDPARGKWEFPGGHHEDGDLTSLHAGIREWEEEVGVSFPQGAVVQGTWTSENGVYQGHVVVIPKERDLVLTEGRDVDNPDDPDGDASEQVAWWDPEDAKKNPALRDECSKTPWNMLKSAHKEGSKMDTPDEFGSLFDGVPTPEASAPAIPTLAVSASAGDEWGLEVSYNYDPPVWVGPNGPNSSFAAAEDTSDVIDAGGEESALPVTYGDEPDEAQQVAARLHVALNGSKSDTRPSGMSGNAETEEERGRRLLAYVDARNAGEPVSGPDPFAHLNSSQDDSEFAAAASQYLATKGGLQTEALKSYSAPERQAIIDEGEGEEGASNLDRLDIKGTHYEAMGQTVAVTSAVVARDLNGGRDVPEDEDMTFLAGDPNLSD